MDEGQELAGAAGDVPALEVALAHVIEHGELRANVKHWATEQWEGRQLPDNINRPEAFITPEEPAARQAWCQRA